MTDRNETFLREFVVAVVLLVVGGLCLLFPNGLKDFLGGMSDLVTQFIDFTFKDVFHFIGVASVLIAVYILWNIDRRYNEEQKRRRRTVE